MRPLPEGEEPQQRIRYAECPTDWRARAAGLGGTAGVFLAILTGLTFTWHMVQPLVAPPAPVVVNLQSFEAPPEPVREVPEGPERVEQQERKPQERKDLPEPPPRLVPPRPSPLTPPEPEPPAAPAEAADPVPETAAPKSLPAPPSTRAASNAQASWEARLLSHLERYRRYPSSSRARREQGVVHVRFRMNRQGRVLSVSLLRSSGFSVLDQAALDTLRRAQPLPAIPDDRPDELELSIPVEFFVGR